MSVGSSIFIPGQEIGSSPWLTVDQDMISSFGATTRDPDPVHTDPEWAAAGSPYGKTIAFGFLTISLLTRLLYGALGVEPERDAPADGHVMNYGFDRLRLVSPVPVDARIRGVFKTKSSEVDAKGLQRVVIETTVEIEGDERPALVAEWVVIYVPVVAAKLASA